MTEEFNLSEKAESFIPISEELKKYNSYREEDVKEFIRLLKERIVIRKICFRQQLEHNEYLEAILVKNIMDDISELAGEKLK